jgi:PAS domain S-box-containing protein
MEHKRSRRLRTTAFSRNGKQEALFQSADHQRPETAGRSDSLAAPPLVQDESIRPAELRPLRGLPPETVGYGTGEETLTLGGFLLDRGGLIKEVDDAGVDLLRADRARLLRHPFASFIAPETRETFLMHFRRTVTRGRIGESELVIARPDGTSFHARISSTPSFKQGRVEEIYSLILDVTPQRKAEEGFRESEERYRMVVENSSDGMMILSAAHTLLYANPKCLQMFGYADIQDLLGSPVTAVIHPDDRDRVTEIGRRRQKDEHMPSRYQVKGLHRDGSVVHVEAQITRTIYRKEEAYLVLLHDVTERRHAEDERRRLSLVVEHAPEMILVLDKAGIVQYGNLAFQRNCGKRSEELVGGHVLECAGGEDGNNFYEALWARLQRGRRWSGRMALRGQDGDLREFDVSISPMRSTVGEVLNQVVTCRDVTTEVMLEQQLRQAHKMEAIGTLAGGIAHDFNNILAAIIGNAELALDDVPAGSGVHHNLEQIFKASQRAKDLVKQILAFSRRDNQEAVLVEAGPLVIETMKLLRSSIPATIDIRHHVEPGRDTVMADAARLQQILMNLCANAAHAMREKGGILEVTLKEHQAGPDSLAALPDLKPGPYLTIMVRDTGHGMSEAVMERIFDPFFTTKRPGEGTGMGLAVVHGIVKSLNGMVSVTSRPGEGSLFTVYLPIITSETDRTVQEEVLPLPGGKEHILFVDDEAPIVEMNSMMLERLGYKVTACSSSRKALELFTSNPGAFDLVITDQTMPDLTGAELTKRLRNVRRDIPVILITGFSETMDVDRARRVGIQRLLMKPIIKHELAEAIRAVVGEKEKK